MRFNYDAYRRLIKTLKEKEYFFSSYTNYAEHKKAVILRHDIDISIERALDMAYVENDIEAKSTYYVLISSDFYNCFSKKEITRLKKIMELGHDIGLHFDEERYEKNDDIKVAIEKEVALLEAILETKVKSVSMHRPSKESLQANYIICNGDVINSYGDVFFHEFKYVSDSRRCWREDVESIINSGESNKLHILTHPALYAENEESYKTVLKNLCVSKYKECYYSLADNITKLDEILTEEDIFERLNYERD